MINRKTAAIIMAAMMSVAPVTQAFAYEQAKVNITLDGLLKKLDVQPIIVEGYTFVSVSELGTILGAKSEWNGEKQLVTVTMPGKKLELMVGSKKGLYNYWEMEMPVAPVNIDGRVMVPLNFICSRFGYGVIWHGDKYLVELLGEKKDYSVIEARTPEDAGKNAVTLTFKQSVENINKNNTALKNLMDSYELIERTKKEVDEFVGDNIVSLKQGFKNIYVQEEIDMFRKQRTTDNTIATMKLNEQMLRESASIQLQNATDTITQADLDIYLLEEKIKLDEENLKNMELKLSLGMETTVNVTNLKNSIAKNKISLNTLNLKHEDSIRELNKILGLDASKIPTITEIKTDNLKYNDDVNAYVTTQLKSAPSITIKELELDNANWEYYTYDELLKEKLHEEKKKYDEDPVLVVQMKNKMSSASRNLDDTKKALEQKIRSTYSSIKKLEESNEALKVDYDTAKNNYEQLVVNYITGYATYYDVQLGQMGLLNAEVAFIGNEISRRALINSYNVPYLGIQE